MICSILIPTRGRVEKLTRAIQSIYSTSGVSNYEIILRVDDDDAETIKMLPSIAERFQNVRYVIGKREGGWGSLSGFFTDLSKIANGSFLWLMNDDIIVEGEWINQLLFAPQTGFIIHPDVYYLNHSRYEKCQGGAFPIIPNKCWEKFGESQIPSPADTGMDQLLRVHNGWKTLFLKDVTVRHLREIDGTLPKESY